MSLRVLILGGTTEASTLARLLAGNPRVDPILSLAGRTTAPRPQPIKTRSGGFGGIDGLMRYLREEKIAAVVDATHPYADQMSAHAVAACTTTKLPLASLLRPPWSQLAGDLWQNVPNSSAAAHALGQTPRCVFLSLGRQELHVFGAAPQHHYVARVIEPPDRTGLPPDLKIIQARGPFDLAAETRLLADEKIDLLVSKNAGGEATYAKIEAARALDLPVVMIARPDKPSGHIVTNPEEAVAWLHDCASRSPRGV
jgi:precorrin-6A/cobalt-precorrin-6A reductase